MTISPTSLAKPASAGTLQKKSDARPVFDMKEIRAELGRQFEAWKALPEDQKLRHMKLEKHGLREQDLDNLPPSEKMQFELKLAESSKQPFLQNADKEIYQGNILSRPVISLTSVLALSDPTETKTMPSDPASVFETD